MGASYNKLVIFDCDGTLVDGQHMIIDAMDLCFEREGLTPPPRSASRAIIGLSLKEAMAQLLPDANENDHARLAERYKDAYFDLNVRSGERLEPLYDGIKDALYQLDRAGYVLAVATGKSMRGLRRVLKGHQLDSLFVSLQTADHHPSKPHPSMVQTAIMEAGSAPEVAVMIGDTSYDMMMARAAGTNALGVTWGYHAESDLTESGAHHIMHDSSSLVDKIHMILEPNNE